NARISFLPKVSQRPAGCRRRRLAFAPDRRRLARCCEEGRPRESERSSGNRFEGCVLANRFGGVTSRRRTAGISQDVLAARSHWLEGSHRALPERNRGTPARRVTLSRRLD